MREIINYISHPAPHQCSRNAIRFGLPIRRGGEKTNNYGTQVLKVDEKFSLPKGPFQIRTLWVIAIQVFWNYRKPALYLKTVFLSKSPAFLVKTYKVKFTSRKGSSEWSAFVMGRMGEKIPRFSPPPLGWRDLGLVLGGYSGRGGPNWRKRSLLSVPLLKRSGNPSKMGIRFGFNEGALLFGVGLLWNVLSCSSPRRGRDADDSHVSWWIVFLGVSPFSEPARINPVPSELERGAVIKGSNDVTGLWWLIRYRSSREFCLSLSFPIH